MTNEEMALVLDQIAGNYAYCNHAETSLRAANSKMREALARIHEGAARQLAEPRDHDNDQYALTDIATVAELALAAPTGDWLERRIAEETKDLRIKNAAKEDLIRAWVRYANSPNRSESDASMADRFFNDIQSRFMGGEFDSLAWLTAHDAAIREPLERRITSLWYALRQGIINTGGVAMDDVSDEFLMLFPAEVGAIKHKQRELEREVAALRDVLDDTQGTLRMFYRTEQNSEGSVEAQCEEAIKAINDTAATAAKHDAGVRARVLEEAAGKVSDWAEKLMGYERVAMIGCAANLTELAEAARKEAEGA
jgi:hypothetical protein